MRKGHQVEAIDYRRSFSDHASPRFRLVFETGNRKLGAIFCTWSSPATCPDRCELKNAGCYAEQGPMRYLWRDVERSSKWPEFLERLSRLPRTKLLRHWVAGDFPGAGDRLSEAVLAELAMACQGIRSFAFTHREPCELEHVKHAAKAGLQVLFSTSKAEDAQALVDRGYRVSLVVPSDTTLNKLPKRVKKLVICPAQTHGKTCETCGLCALEGGPNVAFRTHGTIGKRLDRELTQLKLVL